MKDFIKDLVIAIAIVVAVSLVIKPTIVKERSMESTAPLEKQQKLPTMSRQRGITQE